MKKILYLTLAVAVVLVSLIILFISYANFSDGTRAGVVVKMSRRGYLIKTYEGQLNVGGLTNDGAGVIPTVWDFSVKRNHPEVIKELEDAQLRGNRVKVYYKEKYYKFPWIADTKYYVYKVEQVNNGK